MADGSASDFTIIRIAAAATRVCSQAYSATAKVHGILAGLRLIRIAGLLVAALVAAGGQAFATSPPSVTSIFFNQGPASGGNSVTIGGFNFTNATSVTIGGNAATNVSVVDDNTITASVPAATPPAPTVTAISPTHGGTGGGNFVTITGTNFFDVADVVVTTPAGTGTGTGLYTYKPVVTGLSIGGTAVAAGNFAVTSATQILAFAPAGIPGVAGVLVTTASSNSGSSGDRLYTYTDGGPNISTVGPQFGLTNGGNSIIITGSNFVPGTNRNGTTATTVTIGGNPATNVVVNSTVSLSATVPAGSAGAQTVVVSTVAGSASSSYLYVAPLTPVVTSVTDNSTGFHGGSTGGGNQVTITGANFTGTTSVTFGGVSVSGFTINSAGSISTTTPASTNGAGAVDVVVTVPQATPPSSTTGSGAWTYVTPSPVVTAIAPNIGVTSGGTKVTITGRFFTGATAVKFGATAASFTVDAAGTSITATSPAGSGTIDVTVTTPTVTTPAPGGGQSATVAADKFSYGTPPPKVTSVTPAGGGVGGGNNVTINGSGFTGVTGVTIGGFAATNVAFVSDTQITATTPAHSAGAVNVSVTTAAGTGTGSNLYTYGASAPTVTSIAPNSGTTLGGITVTITGTGFSGTPQVTINGVAAGQVTVTDSSHLTAVTPAGTGTNVPVVVITSFGASAPANIYSYVVPPPPSTPVPTVTGIAPASGSTAGGTHVTITGTDLTGATAVTIGGKTATGVTVVSATSITATTPAGTLGPADVVVTTPGGTGTGTGLYTYLTPPPTVTAILANSGTTLGGTSVTITGNNFTGATSVTIGGTAATGVTVLSATTITAKTPAHTAGPASVVVRAPARAGRTSSPTWPRCFRP